MDPSIARPATAADVAARAGVSRATVSHILNGRGSNFAASTRERVLVSAQELDYRPSAAGRRLVSGRGDTIVILAPNLTIGRNQQDALDRLVADTATIGANVVLRFADTDPERTADALLHLEPLAVVDLGALPESARTRLAHQGIPTVPRASWSQRATVGPDDALAELQVTELIRNGSRQIVYASVADKRADPYSPGRFAAIQRACAKRSIVAPQLVRLPANVEGAATALSPVATANLGVAAYNDTAAAAAVAAATRLGFSVPEQVAVIGVDNTELGQLLTPRLTTVAVSMETIIDLAVEQLAETLGASIEIPPRPVAELFTLIRGDTT